MLQIPSPTDNNGEYNVKTIIDAGETLAHTPKPYLSKQMNGLRASLSPIQYQLSSPHGETIVFDIFPPPLRFSDTREIEGLLNRDF